MAGRLRSGWPRFCVLLRPVRNRYDIHNTSCNNLLIPIKVRVPQQRKAILIVIVKVRKKLCEYQPRFRPILPHLARCQMLESLGRLWHKRAGLLCRVSLGIWKIKVILRRIVFKFNDVKVLFLTPVLQIGVQWLIYKNIKSTEKATWLLTLVTSQWNVCIIQPGKKGKVTLYSWPPAWRVRVN